MACLIFLTSISWCWRLLWGAAVVAVAVDVATASSQTMVDTCQSSILKFCTRCEYFAYLLRVLYYPTFVVNGDIIWKIQWKSDLSGRDVCIWGGRRVGSAARGTSTVFTQHRRWLCLVHAARWRRRVALHSHVRLNQSQGVVQNWVKKNLTNSGNKGNL